MSDDADTAARALRARVEANAGAALIGPDARTLRFTFDRATEFTLAYLTVAMDGFPSAAKAADEMAIFMQSKVFDVLGSPVRLQRAPAFGADPQAPGPFPPGTLIIWRGEGGTPRFGADADGIWSVQLTYLLLPAFAHVTG